MARIRELKPNMEAMMALKVHLMGLNSHVELKKGETDHSRWEITPYFGAAEFLSCLFPSLRIATSGVVS